MNIIALDIGNRYVGIATLDHSGKIPYRHSTIDRKEEDVFESLQELCEQEEVQTIVAGIPYHVEDGSETKQTVLTRQFIVELKTHLHASIDIVEIDETLTSQEAKRLLGIEGAPKDAEHAEAARILLQEYLSQAI